MALTIAKKNPYPGAIAIGGGLYASIASVTFDSSYPTGGESLLAAELSFPPSVDIVYLAAQPTAGYKFEYDYTNSKLKAFTSVKKWTATDDAASIGATTSQDEAVTVTGIATTDEILSVRGPDALEARAVIKGGRASGANTITMRMENSSAGAVDPASGTYTFFTVGANGVGVEVPDTTDLSAVVTRIFAFGTVNS